MGWKFCNIGLDHDTGRIIMKKVDSNGIDAFELQKGDAYYRIDSVQIIKAIGIKDREVGTLKDIGGDRLVIEFEFSKKPEE